MYQIARYDYDLNADKLKFRETYPMKFDSVERAENIVADLMTAQANYEDDNCLEFDGDIHCYAISDLPTFLDGKRNGEEMSFTLYVNADFCQYAIDAVDEYCKRTNIPLVVF